MLLTTKIVRDRDDYYVRINTFHINTSTLGSTEECLKHKKQSSSRSRGGRHTTQHFHRRTSGATRPTSVAFFGHAAAKNQTSVVFSTGTEPVTGDRTDDHTTKEQ